MQCYLTGRPRIVCLHWTSQLKSFATTLPARVVDYFAEALGSVETRFENLERLLGRYMFLRYARAMRQDQKDHNGLLVNQ